MLNPFPQFLAYSLLAPFLLRLVLGIIYIGFGYTKLTTERAIKSAFFENIHLRPGGIYVWVFGIIEIVGGAMLLTGFYTQIASLALAFIMLAVICIKILRPTTLQNVLTFYILIFAATLSLLFLGAGAFAFDLPL